MLKFMKCFFLHIFLALVLAVATWLIFDFFVKEIGFDFYFNNLFYKVYHMFCDWMRCVMNKRLKWIFCFVAEIILALVVILSTIVIYIITQRPFVNFFWFKEEKNLFFFSQDYKIPYTPWINIGLRIHLYKKYSDYLKDK